MRCNVIGSNRNSLVENDDVKAIVSRGNIWAVTEIDKSAHQTKCFYRGRV